MYDAIIIGAGPAGFSAAIYAARYKLKTLIIGKHLGGLIMDAHKVENYPGFKSVSGIELMNKFEEQARNLGVEVREGEVVSVKKIDDGFEIEDKEAKKYQTKTLILATGTERRKLNVPGEDKFLGKGVSYCAICDAPFFRNKNVAVVGGNDSAVRAVQLTAKYARQAYIIYRGAELRAEPYLVDDIKQNEKIKIITEDNVKEVKGDKFAKEIVLESGNKLEVDGLFVEIGFVPAVGLAKSINVNLDNDSHIVVDGKQATNVEGVFAAGDITTNSNKIKQIITAAAEGAIAANAVYNYLKTK